MTTGTNLSEAEVAAMQAMYNGAMSGNMNLTRNNDRIEAFFALDRIFLVDASRIGIAERMTLHACVNADFIFVREDGELIFLPGHTIDYMMPVADIEE
jgi:hypothetical protein